MLSVMILVAMVATMFAGTDCQAAEPALKALIVDGQNNHRWAETTPPLKKLLEETGLFTVDVATTPPRGGDMSTFTPDFAKYDVVVANYTGGNG